MNDYYVLSTGYALSNFIILFSTSYGEGNVSPLSTLAWRMPWMKEPGGL